MTVNREQLNRRLRISRAREELAKSSALKAAARVAGLAQMEDRLDAAHRNTSVTDTSTIAAHIAMNGEWRDRLASAKRELAAAILAARASAEQAANTSFRMQSQRGRVIEQAIKVAEEAERRAEATLAASLSRSGGPTRREAKDRP